MEVAKPEKLILVPTWTVKAVLSMGRRNTHLKPTYREKQRRKPLARVRSAGTLHWHGFDRVRLSRL